MQAHNFIVADGVTDRAKLVDWEKPMLDDGSYDLCHFLTPTSTLWKMDYVLTDAERADFLMHTRTPPAITTPGAI